MAKQTTVKETKVSPNSNGRNAIPKATDPRAELFFLLGCIQGAGVEASARIAELVIDLTAPAASTTPEGE